MKTISIIAKLAALCLVMAAALVLLFAESDSTALLLATKAAVVPLAFIIRAMLRKWGADLEPIINKLTQE